MTNKWMYALGNLDHEITEEERKEFVNKYIKIESIESVTITFTKAEILLVLMALDDFRMLSYCEPEIYEKYRSDVLVLDKIIINKILENNNG